MTTYNAEVLQWIREEKFREREKNRMKQEATSLRYRGCKFIATPSGNTKISKIGGESKLNNNLVKKVYPVKTNKSTNEARKCNIIDTGRKTDEVVPFEDKYSLITGEPEGKSLIDDEGNVKDSFEYIQKAIGSRYGNRVLYAREGKVKNDSFVTNVEINQSIYTNDDIEKTVQEIGKKIGEIEMLFQKLKALIR